MLELKNLSKKYSRDKNEEFYAVDNVNLVLPTGQTCVLLGTSGCGKTTTLKMVNRLIEPTSGEILIDGENVLHKKAHHLRRNIGYTIQSIALFPNMTILENITVVPKLLNWSKEKKLKRAYELLEMVALPTTKEFLSRYPYQLSGGQQQRIGVIRAMAGKPKLLLMDEPFGAIDPINRAIIQDEFRRIAKKYALSVLFVSHDIDEAIKLGDIISIFDKGKVVQHDTPRDLLSRPKNEFISSFLGEQRNIKRLKLYYAHEAVDLSISPKENDGTINRNKTIADAFALLYSSKNDQIVCVDDNNKQEGVITHSSIKKLLNR